MDDSSWSRWATALYAIRKIARSTESAQVVHERKKCDRKRTRGNTSIRRKRKRTTVERVWTCCAGVAVVISRAKFGDFTNKR